jgi:uncharacterized membrane protein YqjE
MATQIGSQEPSILTQEATPSGPSMDGHGVIDLARLAVADVVRLVQLEIQLAKLELREMLAANIRAAIFLAGAGFFGLCLLIAFLVFVPLVFANHVLVAWIEGAVFLVLAAILALLGIRSLKLGPPPRTMTTLKEDAEWAKHLLKRNGR